MASNKSTLVDDFGNTPDWIEIYNTSFAPVNLLNWGLTDEEGTPFKWRFPSTNSGGQGIHGNLCSGTNRSIAGLPLHTSFSLKASGEYLALVEARRKASPPSLPRSFPPKMTTSPMASDRS